VRYPRPKPPAGGIKANYPGFIEPALATSIDKVPSGERWVHEIKFDGYRVQVHLRDAAVKVFTRRGNDWTNRFRKIAADAWNINAGSAIIDGEVVVPAANGTTDFSVLQTELKGRSKRIVMVAFDLLYLNGYDLRKLPLFERKTLLKKIIAKTDIQLSESFEVDGREMYTHACKTGLEGVVSKVRDSQYVSGRVNDWVKKTCAQRETLPIAGYYRRAQDFRCKVVADDAHGLGSIYVQLAAADASFAAGQVYVPRAARVSLDPPHPASHLARCCSGPDKLSD
jgi:bifunctional non-homologous end joining protein LigD